MPVGPFRNRWTDSEWINFQCCLAMISLGRSSTELIDTFQFTWKNGSFLSASLCARLLLEIWGAADYTRFNVLEKFRQNGDLSTATSKVTRLNLGAKGDVPLPWGGAASEEPIHVMDFVRSIRCDQIDVESEYEWLCNASHPSLLQHFYFSMAGSWYDNWSNAVFAEHADNMLDRILGLAEISVNGLAVSGQEVGQYALPVIAHWE